MIDIELKKPNRFKDFIHKSISKLEDIFFSTVQRIPERLIPTFVMDLLTDYLNKRINELQQELVRQQWKSVSLDNAIREIRQQDIEKAPTED